MKKSELKTGMIVKIALGVYYVVLKDCDTEYYGHQDILFLRRGGFFLTGDNFSEDLVSSVEMCTITAVYKCPLSDVLDMDLNNCELIWNRPERTYKDYVLERLPDIGTTSEGYPNIKPCVLFEKFDTSNCSNCLHCWDMEYPRKGGENNEKPKESDY